MADQSLSQETVDALLAAAAGGGGEAATDSAPARRAHAGPVRSPGTGESRARGQVEPPKLERMVRQLDVSLDVVLGEVDLPVREVLELGSGSLLVTEHAVDAPVELRLSGRTVALGEIVVLDDGYALRVTRNLLRTTH